MTMISALQWKSSPRRLRDVDVLNDIAGEVIVENKEKLLANASSDEVREYIEKEYIEKLQEQ